MAFWKNWWKKKNESKKGAEYEDQPLPSEVEGSGGAADDPQLEQRIKARRNNLSVSRSGRYKAKGKERGQVNDDLFQPAVAGGGTIGADSTGSSNSASSDINSKGSFGKSSCREAQLQLVSKQRVALPPAMPASIH